MSENLRHSVSLQKMLMDMRIRKINKMLYMPKRINHTIDTDKINEWVSLQCNSDAQILAGLFRDHTKHISWETFYSGCIHVFEQLYDFIGNRSYCFFTKNRTGSKEWVEKSNYWMIQLLLDYYINSGKTNLPKELLIWYENTSSTFQKKTDYDFYIILDDVSYSGGQTFNDQIRDGKTDINIDQQKILIACPYVSECAYNRYYIGRQSNTYPKYNTLFKSVIMKYWWRDIKVTLDSRVYDLNNLEERQIIYEKMGITLDIGINMSMITLKDKNVLTGDSNSMYYFDHKIADMVSSFPYIYQLGVIKSDKTTQIKMSSNTHDYDRNKNRNVCQQQTYLPFLNNCATNDRIRGDDINKLCVEPWYKKIYDNIHNDYILALDFDQTITNIDLANDDAIVHQRPLDDIFKNKESLIEILNLAWTHLITIYIVSRRKISQIIYLLDKFYRANSITYQQIFEENIYGMLDDYTKPKERSISEENLFWANKKLENLNDIVRKKQISKNQVLFCDDSQLNITTTLTGDFNSILIDKKRNANHVLEVLNTFILQNEIPLCDTSSIISSIPDKYILAVDLNNMVFSKKNLQLETITGKD